jgi:ABC-type phosphate transport system auxiliary subunit
MEELKELDPEMYELEKADRELDRQTLDLSEQYRRAPKDKREALQKQLAEAVSKHFDIRQSRRELHLKRLADELDKLRESITRRSDVRDQIIGKRVAELIGEKDDLAF